MRFLRVGYGGNIHTSSHSDNVDLMILATRCFMKLKYSLLALLPLMLPNVCLAVDEVTIQLRWLHQFQFAGYYMALEKGFYKDAGLEVSLLEGGPDALQPIEEMLSGRSDFAVTSSGVVIDRMEGKPVKAVAAIMQTSPIVWITLKSANITSIKDLVGRKAMLMPAPESAELLTVLKKESFNFSQVEFQPTSFDIQDLVKGKTEAYDGYISNEPYQLTEQGVEFNLINPRDYGVNFYSDVLVTRDTLAESNPELVSRVRDASLKGWEYALNHIEETVHLIHREYAPEKSLEHLRFEARTIRKLILPELVQIGHMNPSRWQFIAESYRNLDMTSAGVDLDGFLFADKSASDYWLAIQVGLIGLVLLSIAGGIILKFRTLSSQLKKTNLQLAEMAIVDQMTQVKNRNGMQQLLPGLLNLANRDSVESSFLMLDIDHFKSVNDCYGHLAGDEALKRFAEILTRHRRKEDLVARVGGEEFVMMLMGADLVSAQKIAEQILDEVRELKVVSPTDGRIFSMTTSIGLVPAKGSLESVWHTADLALYQAKNNGRDSVVCMPGTAMKEGIKQEMSA